MARADDAEPSAGGLASERTIAPTEELVVTASPPITAPPMRAAARQARLRTLAVEDPSSGRIVARVADASATDCRAALAAAHDAFPTWAATPARQRARVLRRAAEILVDDVDDLATIMSAETGKPLAES